MPIRIIEEAPSAQPQSQPQASSGGRVRIIQPPKRARGENIIEDAVGPFKRVGDRVTEAYQKFGKNPSIGSYGNVLKESGRAYWDLLTSAPAEAVNNVIAPRVTEPIGRALYDAGWRPSEGIEYDSVGAMRGVPRVGGKYRVGNGPWRPVPIKNGKVDYNALENEWRNNPQTRNQAGETFDKGVGVAGNVALIASGARSSTTKAMPKGGAVDRLARRVGLSKTSSEDVARNVVSNALKADGATPETVKNVLSEWKSTGASSPSVLDVAAKLDSTGQGTLRRVRGAAMNNPEAHGILTKYRQGVEAGVQDRALNLTQRLEPDMRSTQQFVEDAKALRSANASQNYAPAYAEMVPVDDALRSALGDNVGQEILANARYAAQTQRDAGKVAEIESLMAGNADQVSAGTLDELYQAFRDAGDARMTNPSSTIYNRRAGVGLRGRASDIDSTLDQVPALQPARADYGNLSANIDAADIGGGVINMTPDELSYQMSQNQGRLRAVGDVPVEKALEANRQANRLYARNALAEAIGRPSEGSTGLLNRIANSENMDRKLWSVFGDAAKPYQSGINNELLRVQVARGVDPGIGSKTGLNLSDSRMDAGAIADGVINLKTGGVWGAAKSAIRALRDGAELTPADRKAIIDLVTREADLSVLNMPIRSVERSPSALGSVLSGSYAGREGVSVLSAPQYYRGAAAEEQQDTRQRKK